MSTEHRALDAASLHRMLGAREPGRDADVVSFDPLSGGYSRLSARAVIRWSDGTTETVVLRADPLGKGAFDSDRDDEWAVLNALHDRLSVRTPTPRWYDRNGEFFGTPCFVVDHFAGRPLFQLVEQDLPGAAMILADTAAALHTAPLDVLPGHVHRPADWGSYIGELCAMLGALDESTSDVVPALRYTAAQLAAHRPPPVPLTLVHGDFQPANILVPDTGPVLVIDWEFARIGDPREDIGYYSALPVPPNLYQADPEAFCARYREKTGFDEDQVNPGVMGYFYVLGMTRLLGQMLDSADALCRGESRGIMATWIMNGTAATIDAFVDIARGLSGARS